MAARRAEFGEPERECRGGLRARDVTKDVLRVLQAQEAGVKELRRKCELNKVEEIRGLGRGTAPWCWARSLKGLK